MSLRRRELLGIAAGGTMTAISRPAAARRKGAFPNGFLWGTSGAAYQIEGGNVGSDIWVLEHVKPSIFAAPSGDADDSYHRYAEDIALAAALGFNSHRLSIEWARIEPARGQISRAALDYYRAVLKTCRKHGLAPVVTFNHYSVPAWFAAAGGFAQPDGARIFADYCRTVTAHMGDLIEVAATFNEPNVATVVRWDGSLAKYKPIIAAVQKAAGAATGSPDWSSPLLAGETQHAAIAEAHAAAYAAVKQASANRLPVGITLAVPADRPAGPDSGIERKNAEMLDRWLAGPGDFVGVQSYTGAAVGPDKDLPHGPDEELTQMGYAFRPDAIEGAIRLVASRTKRPIYVTENGVATEDDTRRIAYIKGAVAGVERCLRDGIDVRSYIHWSLLDNWEWMSGYRPKFGLVSVDRATFRRTPKPSAKFLGGIARAGGLG